MIDVLFVAAIAAIGAASHEEQNPVYRELIEEGVKAGALSRKLPPPTLPDGLSVDEQVEAIETLGGARYSFDRLTRKSVVAPQIVRVPDLEPADAQAPLRTADVWFVVFADLDAVADKEFLGQLLESPQAGGRARGLTADQLRARGISPAEEGADREGFGHLTYDLLDKVRISATGHSFWSRTEESIVAAVKVDRRFVGDAKFPNQWHLIQRSGPPSELGPAHPYDGLGFYAKITRLKRPPGALFVEYHAVFAEPVPWFRGTNQLGAKLPAVLQNQVREARRKMMQATSGE